MFWFKRKRREGSKRTLPPLPCPHTWKDFPWYLMSTYYPSEDLSEHVIIEPYVCAHCKERKNIELLHVKRYTFTRKAFDDLIGTYNEAYKNQLAPKPVVEDMINDFIYVDREKLDILEKLRSGKSK